MIWDFKKYYDNIAAIDELGNKISYKELENSGSNLVKHIEDRALVFSLCSNTIGSLVGYTSFLNNDIVPLMLDGDIDRELLKTLLETYKPNYVWVSKKSENEFVDFNKVYEDHGYVLLKSNYEVNHNLYEELGLLLTTSGSTGSPKLVRQSYKNILANTKSIVEYLEIDASQRAITTLPMNYTYGLSIVNTYMYAGATILLTTKSIMEKDFWRLFKEEKATSFGGVPYTYEILDKLRFFRMDLPHLESMTQAGGKLAPELHKKFAEYAKEKGKKFVVMYGQTEATARMAYLPHDKSLEKYGSMGIAIPGGQFELIDASGNVIECSDVVGELKYRGDNVTLGYAENLQDLSKGDERNGILVTGDMAKRDQDGFYFIVGRKKRFLKIFGNRVNLDESERLLKSKFKDFECACAGVDDKMYIFVTSENGHDEVKKYIAETTGLNSAAFKVKYINEIPKNEAGKTLYIKLEAHYD